MISDRVCRYVPRIVENRKNMSQERLKHHGSPNGGMPGMNIQARLKGGHPNRQGQTRGKLYRLPGVAPFTENAVCRFRSASSRAQG
jgi:hypothetical protein